jgi:IclR family transcriptional regulator, pca regulon regulatory protein
VNFKPPQSALQPLVVRYAPKCAAAAQPEQRLGYIDRMPPPRDVQPRDRVAGLEKGLQVIAAFDDDRARQSIADVAAHCGLTRAAARRYLITLEHLGYAGSDGKLYSLTPKVLRLGQSYMYSARLPRIVQPELNRLASTLKEASSAGVLDGNDVLCVAALSVGRIVLATLQPGTRVPAYCTSNGRVLLSALSEDDALAWIERQTLQALTPNTVLDAQRLAREVARTRAQGYAMVDQELEPGLRTIAVPLKNARGQVLAAINVSVNAAQVSMDKLVERCLPALLRTQAKLRTLL